MASLSSGIYYTIYMDWIYDKHINQEMREHGEIKHNIKYSIAVTKVEHRPYFEITLMGKLRGAPIARFGRPTWGPPGADRTLVGPMLAPWTLLSGCLSMHSGVLLWCSPIWEDITWINTETEAEYQSYAGSTKDNPCLALMGKLWGVFYEYLWENLLHYNSTTLYIMENIKHVITTVYNSCTFFLVWNSLPVKGKLMYNDNFQWHRCS